MKIDISRKPLTDKGTHYIISDDTYQDLDIHQHKLLLLDAFDVALQKDKGDGFRICFNYGNQKHIKPTHIHVIIADKGQQLPRMSERKEEHNK